MLREPADGRSEVSRVRRCPACNGTWYSTDKLRILKDREASGDYRWIDFDLWRDRNRFRSGKQERLPCPKDGQTMVTVRYGDSRIRADICGKCKGTWPDRREYDRILAYLEEVVDTETVGDYLDDLQEGFIEIFTGSAGPLSELADFLNVLHLLELRFILQHPNIATTIRTAARGVPGA